MIESKASEPQISVRIVKAGYGKVELSWKLLGNVSLRYAISALSKLTITQTDQWSGGILRSSLGGVDEPAVADHVVVMGDGVAGDMAESAHGKVRKQQIGAHLSVKILQGASFHLCRIGCGVTV